MPFVVVRRERSLTRRTVRLSIGDQVHCCPHGYQCHVEEERCVKGPAVVVFVEWKEKQIAHRRDRHRDEQRIFLVAEKSEETRNMLRLENSLSKGVRSAEIISSSPLLQPVGVGLIQCPGEREPIDRIERSSLGLQMGEVCVPKRRRVAR